MKISTKITLHGSANIFVVPNCAIIPCKDPSFEPYRDGGRCGNQSLLDGLREMASINHKSFDGGDPLIQLWFHNDESDNITDQRIEVELNGDVFTMFLATHDYIPYSYIRKLHEGETVWVKIPVILCNKQTGEEQKAVWNAELKASQMTSRYRRNGKFEDVVQSVINASDRIYSGTKSHNFQRSK